MRRFALVVALLFSLVPVGAAHAIIPGNTTFTVFANVSGHGYSGVISLTKKVDNSSATLTIDMKGMRPFALATVRARAGSCKHEGFGVVRVRWIGAFRHGHWKMTVKLTPHMIVRWNDALESGRVNFTFEQGGKRICGNGLAV